MPELAALDNYQGSEPVMLVENVSTVLGSSPNEDFTLLEMTPPSLWRVRVVTVRGSVTGTMGTAAITLSIDVDGGAGLPWTNATNASGIHATSPQALSPGNEWGYTWSTDIGDSYVGFNFQWGYTAMLGFPFVFVPGNTRLVLEVTGSGGFDGELNIRDGFIEVEKFPTSAVQGGGDNLPDLTPVWYLSEVSA